MKANERFDAAQTNDGRYRLLVEAVTDYAIYMLDATGVVTSWNPGAQRFKGYLAGEIVGQHFSRFYTDEDRAVGLPRRALETAAREGKFETEGWRVRKDGTRFWAHVLIDPIRSPDGELVGFAKITRDLTERRQLASTEALLRTFYDHSTECHVLLTARPGGSFVFEEANPATLALYGKSREEVIGHTTDEVFDAKQAAEVNRHLAQGLQTEGPYHYERMHGDRILEAICVAVRTAGELPRLVGTARDVTESRGLEEQLRQSHKMEAIGQLTGGIAHDFNNLLTGISGSLELLRTRLSQGRIGELDRYIIAAQGAAKRAAALTHRLLAFARRQTLEPKAIGVNPLVIGMQDLIQRTMGPEITVEVVTAASLWTTLIDPNQLENALLNLCINARDAMPSGGRLTIETANTWIDARTARTRDLPAGQYVALSVSDTGVGMTPEVMGRAFDPFFTTKPIGLGTGLGLSMVYGFMRQSGGQARIHSAPGKGTRVSLYLPRHDGAAAETASGEAAAARPAGRGETVLVVDDEPTVRMLIVEVLEEMGYRALEAEDGPSGLRILHGDQRLDLLISDVGLPGGMNGRQMVDAARAHRPELKVLFVTGYADNAVVSHQHLDRGMHVLTKPFAIDDLARQVKAMVG